MVSEAPTSKILYQLVSPLHRLVGESEIKRREGFLKRWASPAVDIHAASPESGPDVVESLVDGAMVFANLNGEARRWFSNGYAAVIIGCFSDPGIDALRELTSAAVIGPGEAALLAAAQFGERFSVLSSEPSPKGLRRRIRSMGLSDHFASERMVGASVAELRRSPQQAREDILDSARACLSDGADVLVLGCLSMCFVDGLVESLQTALGVPVINPVIAGIKSAEAALSYGVGGQVRNASGARC